MLPIIITPHRRYMMNCIESINIIALSPPEILYTRVIIPIINTENSIDQPDIT